MGKSMRSSPYLVAVRALDGGVRQALDRPAQNASVVPSASGLNRVAGHDGLRVDNTRLAATVERALVGQLDTREVAVPTVKVHPTVTTADLEKRYPAYIVIDRGAFTLHYYRHLRLQTSYPIAVGMQGL